MRGVQTKYLKNEIIERSIDNQNSYSDYKGCNLICNLINVIINKTED